MPGSSPAPRYTFTTLLDSQRDGLDTDALRGDRHARHRRRDGSGHANRCDQNHHHAPGERSPGRRRRHRAGRGLSDLLRQRVLQPPAPNPSINELGEVGFQGNPRRLTTRAECGIPAQRARRQGVFLGRGGPLTTIAHTINPPGGDFIAEFLVADQSVNTFGKAELVPELDDTFEQGLFVGSKNGTFQQRFISDRPTRDGFIFNNISSRVSMNELGQIPGNQADGGDREGGRLGGQGGGRSGGPSRDLLIS